MTEHASLATSRIVAFVATMDPARAKTFYAGTLGLPLVHEDAFALVFEVGATTLRVTTVQRLAPAAYTVLGWAVPDIVAAVRALRDAGVSFERYPGMQQDELGVWASPDGTNVAWFKDPDGNTLSLSAR